MFSRIILFPIIIAAAVVLYLMIFYYRDYYPPIFIVLVLLTTSVLMVEQKINEWWAGKRKMSADPSLRNFLYTYIPYYKGLTPQQRKDYEHELEKYMLKADFFAKLSDDLPDDIKALACIYPAIFSYQTGINLSKKYKTVVFYPHPFLTPDFSEEVHVSETNLEDGVFIYAIEHLHMGYRGSHFFNVAIYETACAWLNEHLEGRIVKEKCPDREEIFKLGTYGDDELSRYFGMPPANDAALLIHHFFVFPENLKKAMPELYESLVDIFGDYHVLTNKPIIY